MSDPLIIPYKPRDVFKPYHEMGKRFAMTIAHRRCGKSVARINRLLKSAIECPLLNPRFGYLAPSFIQAKDIAWAYLKHYSAPIIALGGRANESELSVVLPHNNATIRLYGAENADRMNGIYFDGICIDEAQLIPKRILGEIIMPCLADRKGWLDVTGKPRGWNNMLGDLYKQACNDPDWFVQVMKASQTKILDDKELAMQRKLMSEDEYEQEFECSFEAALRGGVYSKWMQDAMEQGRIGDIAYDEKYPVYTAWDLGYSDSTVIWFYQVGGGWVHFIDYYENSGEGIGHYCDILKGVNPKTKLLDNPVRASYRYAAHYVPFDANFKLQAAGGRSIAEQARHEGVRMIILPEVGHADSIEAGRVTLPRSAFKDGLGGIEHLRNYHFDWDEKLRMYKKTPKHDNSSHAARAFELAARMWKTKVVTTAQVDAKNRKQAFFRKRRQLKMDNIDPYKVKPTPGKT